MNNDDDIRRLEQWFDGEIDDKDIDLDVLLSAPEQASYLKNLEMIRGGVQAVATPAIIADAQFPAFMEGIRERVERPAPRFRGLWAMLSLTAALFIAVISVLTMISSNSKPVSAGTVVEESSTDLEGAKASTHKTKRGTTIVWVEAPQKDIL